MKQLPEVQAVLDSKVVDKRLLTNIRGILRRSNQERPEQEFDVIPSMTDVDWAQYCEDFRHGGIEVIDLPQLAIDYHQLSFTIIGKHPVQDSTCSWCQDWFNNKPSLISDFLNDTLNFVLTGNRVCSVTHWENLFKFDADDARETKDYPFDTPIYNVKYIGGDLTQLPPNDFFLKWINQKNGIMDLIHTYKILFSEY